LRTARLACLAILLSLVLACGRRTAVPGGTLRLGYFPNITHAQALVGVADGTFARALGGRVQAKVFNAGPAAMEALVAGELDATYVGAGPVVTAYLRTRGEALEVVAGAASGGAALVVKDARGPSDLVGKRVASPQLGNTQDVSLRIWLRSNGLSDQEGARGVQVTPLSNPDILAMFARGDLAGAWVPEPWGARLVAEAGGRILVDERTLWEGGRFPTTVLAVSRKALETHRAEVLALVRAHLELTRRWQADRAGFGRTANDAYGKLTGKPLPAPVLEDALSRIDPTSDPLPGPLAEMARRAQSLGFAPGGDISGIVDASILQETARR